MIASIGPGLPIDLLTASGRYRGPVAWDADRETPAADTWLESKFPGWSRSILEDWLSGALDDLEVVVFSRADDASQRLYYYICEVQRTGVAGGPEPILFDVAKVPRAASLDHMSASVRDLAQSLGLATADLEQAIATVNGKREQVNAKVAGTPCLLTGTPPPDRRLHAVVEAAGFAAIGPTLAEIWLDPGPVVEEGSGDPLAAIARQLHARPDDQRGFEDHAFAIADRARTLAARAAVLWYTEEDEARVWTVPAVREALEAQGIPVCLLTRRDWSAQDGASEEIRAFLEGVPA